MFQRFGIACIPLEKILLVESAANRAPLAAPLNRTWKTYLPSPIRAVQRHESHWGRGLASTADVEDTRRIDLGLLQQLNGQYGGRALSCWSKTPILLICILLILEDVLMAMRSTLLFIDDGVPVHFLWYLKQFLDCHYLCQFMGQNGPILWPFAIAWFNSCCWCQWDCFKGVIYSKRVNMLVGLRCLIEADVITILHVHLYQELELSYVFLLMESIFSKFMNILLTLTF